MEINTNMISESARTTHLLEDDEVLTLRRIVPGHESGTYGFYFDDAEGLPVGCFYEYQLPEEWRKDALEEMPC